MQRLTLERLTIVITLALIFAVATRVPVDTDTWWHLRSGEYTLTKGMIYTDPFSHTFAGEPWINHSWGAQIVMLAVYTLMGNVGLSLYTAVLAVGGMAFIMAICRGNVYVRGFLLVLGATTAAVFWSARPQMFTFFFSCVTLFLLYRYKNTPNRQIWWLVPMMAVWANLHAGYSVGFIFIGAFIGGELLNALFQVGHPALGWRPLRTLVMVAVLCVGTLLLTPYGVQTLLVPFQTVGIDALREYIQEWNSPNFQGRETWTFIALIVVSFGAAWVGKTRFDWTGFALFGGTLFLALLYGRNISVFAVAVLPQVSIFVDSALTERGWVLRPRRMTARIGRLNAVLLCVVLLGVGVYVGGGVWAPNVVETTQAQFLPIRAVEFMKTSQTPPRLFNSYNWGGYLMFALPDVPVFIDGRTDLYGDFLRTYLNMTSAVGDWQALLDTYQINTVMVENGVGLDSALRQNTAWTLVYEDDMAVIYTRNEAIQS